MEDRISCLPRDIIDHILELLPVQDAARTSILSQKWRNIWPELPYLVLDKLFCSKLSVKSQSVFKETVDKILLQHFGDIVKFDLDVSEVQLSPDTNIDRWMIYVIRNGVKKLTFNMLNNNPYKLPSRLFNCATLTHLKLFNCVFRPPSSVLGFQNLVDLYLEKITFMQPSDSSVIKAPVLAKLKLKYCDGTRYLNIVSPQLESLVFTGSHYDIELSCFMNCEKLTTLSLLAVNDPIHAETSTLVKFLLSIPILEVLTLNSSFLEVRTVLYIYRDRVHEILIIIIFLFATKFLSAGAIPTGLPFTVNCMWYLRLGVDFGELGRLSYAVELIKCSPKLSRLDIWVSGVSGDTEAVMEYLDTPACLDKPLDKLKHVFIRIFKGSKVEMLFVKLLFAQTPSLVKMSIEQAKSCSSEELLNIATGLMRFPRASPKAELFYLRNLN